MTLMTGIAGFKRGKYSKGKLNREVRK
jgi:hypothetical protein